MAQRTYARGKQVRAWAVGLALFAGMMMLLVGTFQALAGLAAVLRGDVYVASQTYAFGMGVTSWGWVHLVLGAVVAVAGFFVMAGYLWARAIAIAVVAISAVITFLLIPYYPFWPIAIITFDVLVIWALCQYGRHEADPKRW